MYTGNKVGLGLLSTADKSVPVSPRSGDCSKVERNGRRSGRPVIVMLKWRQWVENDLPVTAIVNSTLEGGDYRNGVRMLSAVFAVAVPDVAVEWYRCGLVGWYAQPLWAEAFAWPSDQPIATQQCSNRQKAEANRLVCSEQALSSFFSFTGVINPTLRWRCHRCSGWTENNHRCCSLRSHFSEDNLRASHRFTRYTSTLRTPSAFECGSAATAKRETHASSMSLRSETSADGNTLLSWKLNRWVSE